VVVVRNPDQDSADILWPALNIGFDQIVGELRGGVAAWRDSGEEVITTPLVRPDLVRGTVLDIRQATEYESGHLPESVHIELGGLPDHTGIAPQGPTVVMCGHGERAMTGASLLQRAGHRDVAVLLGGAHDWADATGRALEEGR
jgi:rhodanese-related sulfurtransferase